MADKIVLINWARIVAAVLWWFEETSYFGWNGTPHSLAELFADGLAFALWASSFRVDRRSSTDE